MPTPNPPVNPPWLGVTGLDGITPVYLPEGRWCWWEMREIYLGPTGPGQNRYVPKVGDFVMDSATGIAYECVAVDTTTLISELVIKQLQEPPNVDNDDLLLSYNGYNVNTYRLYYDESVVPHVINIDVRLKVGGTMVDHCKIFRGTDLSSSGKVISMQIDTMGNFLTENVDLELVAMNSHDNHAIKSAKEAYTRENLANGEICTAVFYDAAGHVVSIEKLLVVATSFIRDVSAGTLYVSHIALESSFLSTSSDTTLEYPMNIPVSAMNLIGRVFYSDGSMARFPVDGDRFTVMGLNTYVATQPGQTFPIVLRYRMANNEQAVGSASASVTADNKYITLPMTLKTLVQDGAYTVKLFGYPVWVDSANGYRMDWWLYNLDRTIRFNVTPYVSFNSSLGTFNPKAYGILQRKSVSLNLQSVSGVFRSYIHTQTIDIVLRAEGSDRTTNWSIGFDPVQDPQYGMSTHARVKMINSNQWLINVKSDFATQAEWLEKLYNRTLPVFDRNMELAPPVPTHFAITYANQRYEYPLSSWDKTLVVGLGLVNEGSVYVQFFKRTGVTDIELSVAGLICWPDATLVASP